MAWGISIWGVNVWGGGPSLENLSYEIPDSGGAKGEAELWTVAAVSEQEMIGAFEAIGGAWDPWEDFEEQWRLLFHVHMAPDTVNPLVSTYPATTQPMAITMANELALKYPAHLRLVDQPAGVENGSNEPWAISDGATLTLKVDRGNEQTITLTGLTSGAATAEQVADSLNLQLFEARATVTSGGARVTITTTHRGMSRFLEITGGTANAVLAFSTGEQTGTDNVHLEEDTDNIVLFSPDPATDYSTLALVVMTLKEAYNLHAWEWPDVHRKWDNANLVTSPDVALDPPNPTELPQLLTLVNELYIDFNLHLAMQGYGDFNDTALFAFLDSHLIPGVFDPNLGSEGFERAWAINDLFPVPINQGAMVDVDGPAYWTIVIDSIPDDGDYLVLYDGAASVTFEFDTDSSWNPAHTRVDIAGAVSVAQVRYTLAGEISNSILAFSVNEPASDTITLTPTDASRVTEDMLTEATAAEHLTTEMTIAPWPDGHEEFLSVFEYIDGQLGIKDTFEANWLLPGSVAGKTNGAFHAKYWQSADEEWAFRSGQLSAGIIESFEEDWKDNEVGTAAYWSGSEWRFLDSQLWAFGVEEYTFADYNLVTQVANLYTPLPSDFSRNLYAEVTELIQANMPAVSVTFKDALGATKSLIFWFDPDEDTGPGDKVYDVSVSFATPLITDPRYRFEEQFSGAKEVTFAGGFGPESGGAVDIKGWERTYEDFSGDWTLSLS